MDFRVFDEAGCHVGYRVHAHLYCLSHATPSYLVAEDSRGLGVHETLGRLGVEGMGSGGGALATTVWSAMPRLGSQRTRITRRFGSLASRMAHLVDVGPELLGQLEADRKVAHARHAQAKQEIRATLPAMEGMLDAIP